MEKGRKKRLVLVAKLVITMVLLLLIFSRVPVSEVLEALRGASIPLVVFGILLSLPRRYLAAMQMAAFTRAQGLTISTWQIFKVHYITSFYAFFLPGFLAGGVLGWYRMKQVDRQPLRTFSSLIFNRIFETIMICLTGLIFWGLDYRSHHNWPALFVFAGLMTAMVLLWVISQSSLLQTITNRLGNFRRLPQKVFDILEKLRESAQLFGGLSKKTIAGLTLIALCRNLAAILTLDLFAMALDLKISFINMGWMRSFLNLVEMVPLTISGIGIRDVSLIYLMQDFGTPASAAVAVSFLLLFRSIIMGLVGGLFELHHAFTTNR
ncbi:MAG: lysylphosphatidylglycerol synthase transmembrane domain-containing protein [Acidobacteriota bacterium]|nr:lysylphosphatidylglycerol synthase transmembrane domain-containing protein [Acidobacteriota bacterium]